MVADNLTQVDIGWDVCAEEGVRVGHITELGPGYVVVDPGLLRRELFIPVQAIAVVDEVQGRITIRLAARALKDARWAEPNIDASADGGW